MAWTEKQMEKSYWNDFNKQTDRNKFYWNDFNTKTDEKNVDLRNVELLAFCCTMCTLSNGI